MIDVRAWTGDPTLVEAREWAAGAAFARLASGITEGAAAGPVRLEDFQPKNVPNGSEQVYPLWRIPVF